MKSAILLSIRPSTDTDTPTEHYPQSQLFPSHIHASYSGSLDGMEMPPVDANGDDPLELNFNEPMHPMLNLSDASLRFPEGLLKLADVSLKLPTSPAKSTSSRHDSFIDCPSSAHNTGPDYQVSHRRCIARSSHI